MTTPTAHHVDFAPIADDDNPLIDTLDTANLAEMSDLWVIGQTNIDKHPFANHLFQPPKTIISHRDYALGDFRHVSMQLFDDVAEMVENEQAIDNIENFSSELPADFENNFGTQFNVLEKIQENISEIQQTTTDNTPSIRQKTELPIEKTIQYQPLVKNQLKSQQLTKSQLRKSAKQQVEQQVERLAKKQAEQEAKRQAKIAEALANPKIHENLLKQKKSMLHTKTISKDTFNELENDLQVIDLAENISLKNQQIYRQAIEILANPTAQAHYQKALAIVQKFAHANTADAMLRLALWSLRGNDALSIAKNSEQGLDWLKKSALLADNRAEKLLSKLYFSGELVGLDTEQGKYWLNQSAEHGHEQAKKLQQSFNTAEMLKETRAEEDDYLKKLGLGVVALVVFALIIIFAVEI